VLTASITVGQVADRIQRFTDALEVAAAAQFPRYVGETIGTPEQRRGRAYAAYLGRLTPAELGELHRLICAMLGTI
jgi:hypothetical protein